MEHDEVARAAAAERQRPIDAIKRIHAGGNLTTEQKVERQRAIIAQDRIERVRVAGRAYMERQDHTATSAGRTANEMKRRNLCKKTFDSSATVHRSTFGANVSIETGKLKFCDHSTPCTGTTCNCKK
jgi:hypothetical protein